MKKCITCIIVIVMMNVLSLSVISVAAEKPEYVWVLVDVVDHDSAERWAVANESTVYQSDYSCSLGNISVKTSYIGKTEDWRNPPRKQGEGVRITAAFSKPPERLYAGEEVNISVTVSASDNTLSFFTFSGYASANFDKPDLLPGSISRGAIRFTDGDGKIQFDVGAKNNYETFKGTFTAKPPAGSEEGEQLALRQQFYMGIGMGTYYIYEWRDADYQPIRKPQKNTSPEWLSQSNDPSPFQGDPGMKRSGVGISDLYGEVLVVLYDDDGYYVDSYTPNLGGDLPVNAVIETGHDSGVILSLRDMTTFVMKSNTSVKIGDQSETENRLSILVGHVWGNVKQMIKDGSMDIDMSQAVAGIKGTTFILEDDGETSTVKVFEGEVELTPHGGGNPVLVKGSNTVSATQAVIGTVQSFDMDAELAKWSESVQEMTRQEITEVVSPVSTEATEESKGGLPIGMIASVVIAVLLAGSAIGFILIRSRKKLPH